MKAAIKHLKLKRSQLKAVITLDSTTIFNKERKDEIKELDEAIELLEKHIEA
jgi:hypothetical protein